MKKLLFILITTTFLSVVSHAQSKLTMASAVTDTEFKEMDEYEKTLTSYVDAAIFALQGLNLQKEYKAVAATIRLKKDDKVFRGSITIDETPSEFPVEQAQSCTICGLYSGRVCFQKVVEHMQNGTIIIRVEKVSDCYVVSWD